MNSLSLLIYAVELITNLNTIATTGVVLFTVGIGVSLFIWLMTAHGDSRTTKEERDHLTGKMTKWRNRFITGLMISLVLTVFVPSRQTTIMIAASEVAEVVVQSEQAKALANDVTGIGSDAVDLLRTYIQTEQKAMLDSVKTTVTDTVKGAVTDVAKDAVATVKEEVAK